MKKITNNITESTSAIFITSSDFENINDIDLVEDIFDGNEQFLRQDKLNLDDNDALKTAVKLLATPTVCSMLLDQDFWILYISHAVECLFKGYYSLEKKPFFNIFSHSLEKKELDDLLKKLKSPETGYSWSGILKHKTRYRRTMYTKTNIFPLFEQNKLSGYWVMFENISDSYLVQYKDMMISLLNASKLKDNDTGFHNERLNYYSKRLAEALFDAEIFPQIDADFIENISTLAAIHDIGKIGTPDYILQKKGKLTPIEWSVMKEHTINGTLILSNYPIPMAKEITLSHHERWDGSGYPYKLIGDMIPLSARIVAIADVYDALRMKRPYKESMDHKETVKYMADGAGSHFDPSIIEVFKTISDDFNTIWEENKDGQVKL